MRKQLLESNTIGRPKLDRENGVVRDVKILGLRSSHGYRYSPDACRAAAKLYEGKAINVDHPQDRSKLGASRSYRDRFGKLRRVHYVEGKGLYGDLHYNRGHQLSRQFEWDVEHSPDNLGLSHNASGRAAHSGDLIESIEEVRSVDLVADPATTMGLFEARGGGPAAPPPPRTLPQVAADAAYGIVASEEIDMAVKRKLLLGLLDVFAEAMEGVEDDGSDLEDEDVEPSVDSGGVGLKSKSGLAESRLLDLLTDGSSVNRRRLIEGRLIEDRDLQSLLN